MTLLQGATHFGVPNLPHGASQHITYRLLQYIIISYIIINSYTINTILINRVKQNDMNSCNTYEQALYFNGCEKNQFLYLVIIVSHYRGCRYIC